MSFRFTFSRTVSMVALGGLCAPAFVPVSASAATSTAKKVPVVAGNPAPLCSSGVVTTVAAMTNTKYAAAINVYTEPATTSQLRYSLGVGLEIKGAVVFTVVKTEGDWLMVNVPARPNGTTGWIKKSEVKTYTHRYEVKIDTATRRMAVCNAGKSIQTETIAVGASKWPTPRGTFYTVDLVRPKGGPNGPYGAFAFGLSGFSESPELENWNGGDGRIAIHGTNQPKLLGQAVSHGCIRVSNVAITKMRKTLPLGVPVSII